MVATGLSGVGAVLVTVIVVVSPGAGPEEPVRQPADAVMRQVRSASRIYERYLRSISYTMAQRI
jgi:hypothetical protein